MKAKRYALRQRDFGDMEIRMGFGEGASPVLHGDSIVINWDHQGQSFITALDKRTGEEKWRAERDEITSWATPLIVEHDGSAQVITSATNRVRSYDLETGRVVWVPFTRPVAVATTCPNRLIAPEVFLGSPGVDGSTTGVRVDPGCPRWWRPWCRGTRRQTTMFERSKVPVPVSSTSVR